MWTGVRHEYDFGRPKDENIQMKNNNKQKINNVYVIYTEKNPTKTGNRVEVFANLTTVL